MQRIGSFRAVISSPFSNRLPGASLVPPRTGLAQDDPTMKNIACHIQVAPGPRLPVGTWGVDRSRSFVIDCRPGVGVVSLMKRAPLRVSETPECIKSYVDGAMTAVAGIIDPDADAKATFLDAVQHHWDSYDDAVLSGRAGIGPLECRWQACRGAPVSTAGSGQTRVWVLGRFDTIGAGDLNPAEELAVHLEAKGAEDLTSFSGYFLACAGYRGHVYVFCDQLGLFPCYYATAGRTLLVGTSSDLPAFHPSVTRRLNRKALVAHLLCMHEVLGESLWDGVRRLGQGEILCFADGHLNRLHQRSIPISDDSFGVPAAEQLERAHEAMLDGFRAYGGRTVSLLCSGGLDSRLAAAYLDHSSAEIPMAYILGDPKDNDYRCARGVFDLLQLKHRRVPVDASRFPEFLDYLIVSEQLANGVNNPSWWVLNEHLVNAPAPLVTGYLGDAVLGGSHISFGYDPSRRAFTFEKLFQAINAWALPESTIGTLIPGERTVRWIAEIKDQLRALYESFPGYPFQKAWQFDLMHRQRFHVGASLRRFSRILWPTAPLACSALLRVAGGMPASTIMDRRLQKDLLIRRFPKLAGVPLDMPGPYPRQLIPSLGYRLRAKLTHLTLGRWRRLRGRESRYYYRIYSLDNEGWCRIRTRCRSLYDELPAWIDREQWRAAIPELGQPIADVRPPAQAGFKSLLGVVLWHHRYAEVLTAGD